MMYECLCLVSTLTAFGKCYRAVNVIRTEYLVSILYNVLVELFSSITDVDLFGDLFVKLRASELHLAAACSCTRIRTLQKTRSKQFC